MDDDEWEPDLDFLVEIYEIDGGARMKGDDTQTRITILDEDCPGTLGFEKTDIRTTKSQQFVTVILKRSDGSSGSISVTLKTLPAFHPTSPKFQGELFPNAVENEDYEKFEQKIVFGHGEVEKEIKINLAVNNDEVKPPGEQDATESETPGSDDQEEQDKMFSVVMCASHPAGVKMSKRNVCIITLSHDDAEDKKILAESKLIEYFLS